MRRWLQNLHDGPAYSLRAYLLLALLLRLPAVLCADGYDFPDQQFQYVDPAWHLATGQAWHEPWEYRDGMRSWLYPGVLAAVFRVVTWFGSDEPMTTMRMVRAVHAVFTLLPLAAFWLVVVRWRPIAAPRLPLLLFAVAGLLVTAVQPSGPSFALVLVVTAGLVVTGPGWGPAAGGLCLGFAFGGRFQDAVFGPAFLGVLLWQRRFAAALQFALACLPGLVAQGCVDFATSGTFFGSPWRYVQSNVGGNDAANAWRTQPKLFYVYAGIVPILALLPWPRVLAAAWARLRAGAMLLPAACAGALLHLAVHSCIPRKALRFEYPAFVLLLAVVLAGAPAASGAVARLHTMLLLLVHAGWWVLASFWFGNAGAVRFANWLRTQPEWRGELLVVGGDATTLGGYFYARPPADRVRSVRRDALAGALTGEVQRPPFVVALREPLTAAERQQLGSPELVATFAGMFDLRAGDRRFVYRWR